MGKNTLTFFGRLLRVLRLENAEILYDMANKLGMSSSYLSMIETGVRAVPSDLLEKIRTVYSLNENRHRALLLAIENDRNTRRGLSVVLDGLHRDDYAYVAFAEKLESFGSANDGEGDVSNAGLQKAFNTATNGRNTKRSVEKARRCKVREV